MGNNNEKETGGIILTVLFALGFLIYFSLEYFFFVLSITFIFLFITIIIFLIELIYGEAGEFSYYTFLFGFLPFLAITLILGFIGFGVGSTSIGEASLEFYSQVTGVQNEITNELNLAINEIIKESCESLDEESCNNLKTFAKTAQTIQEVRSKSEELKKVSNQIKKIS